MSKKNARVVRRRKKQSQQRKQQIGALMIGIGVVGLIVFGILQVNRLSQPLAASAIIAKGEVLFEQNCAACHGLNGEGHIVPEAPALNGNEHAWHHPDGALQRTILNGGQIMPGFAEQLSLADTTAIIRYFQTWWKESQLTSQQSMSAQDPLQQ